MEYFRIFAYDPSREAEHGIGGCVFRVADIEGRDENDALARFKERNSRAAADDDVEVKFFARSHREPDRWPNVMTGRLSQEDLRTLSIRGEISPAYRERL